MNTLLKKTVILFGFMFMTNVSYAESRWVSDELLLPLRSGKGNEFRILDKGLKSGTKLKVLEEDPTGEWTRVETPRNKQGWVRSQYIVNQPTAAIQLKSMSVQLAKYKAENGQLKTQLSSTKNNGSQLSKELNSAEQKVARLTKELQNITNISSGAIALNDRHQTLTREHQILLTELDVLKADNEQLQDSSNHTFFLYGIGAVLLGAIIALIAPHLRPKKRHSEWR